MIFDIVAAGATLGISLASIAGKGAELAKTIFKAVQDGATLASKTLTALGHKMAGQIFDLASSVAGFISSGFKPENDPVTGDPIPHKFRFHPTRWEIYKFVRGTTEKGANLAGAKRVGGFLNVLGLVDDAGDLYMQGRDFFDPDKGGGVLTKNVMNHPDAGLWEKRLALYKKVNSVFMRIDTAVGLAH